MDQPLVPNQPLANEPSTQNLGQSGSGPPPNISESSIAGASPQPLDSSQSSSIVSPPPGPQTTQETSPLDFSSLTATSPLTSDTSPLPPSQAPPPSDVGPVQPLSAAEPANPDAIGRAPASPISPRSTSGVAHSMSMLPDPPFEQPLIVTQGPLSSTPPVMQTDPAPPPPPPPPASVSQQGGNPLVSQPPADSKGHWLQSKMAIVILILLTVGIAIALLLVFRPKEAQPPPSPPQTETEAPKVLTLSIESPTDGTVVTNGEVRVKGKTLPNTVVVFYTDTADNSVESDRSGNFEGKIALASGINTLTVTAIDEGGEEKGATLDIVYDEE